MSYAPMFSTMMSFTSASWPRTCGTQASEHKKMEKKMTGIRSATRNQSRKGGKKRTEALGPHLAKVVCVGVLVEKLHAVAEHLQSRRSSHAGSQSCINGNINRSPWRWVEGTITLSLSSSLLHPLPAKQIIRGQHTHPAKLAVHGEGDGRLNAVAVLAHEAAEQRRAGGACKENERTRSNC